ncbi:MAG TPA: serine hydrolase domain-containing protein [Gemmatimonadales bacterium]
MLLAFTLASLAFQAPDTMSARIDSIFTAWNGTDRPGCALGVDRDGQALYRRGYGMADLQHDLAITPASIFHVASISKQFAAFTVALLAQDGRLSLDDEVRKYVPEVPDFGTPITIRHLIHHTSGLRDQWELLAMAGWRFSTDLITEQDVLRITARQKALNFAPGSEYAYSNTGYTLLGTIVKRVTGQSLQQVADARIFKPLGMTSTHFHDDHSMIVRGRTSAYEPRQGGGWRISIPTFDTYGATSLFTTVDDLLKWERNFDTKQVGGEALLAAAQQPTRLTTGMPLNYGYGLSMGSYRGTPAIGHGGADAGYRADVVRFPEHGLAVAVLCNGSPAAPGNLSRQVAGILLADKLAAVPATVAVTITEARARALAGLYRLEGKDEILWLVARGNRLTVPDLGLGLTATSDSTFRVPDFPVTLRFSASPGGLHTVALEVEGQPPQTWRQQPAAPAPTTQAMAALAGTYWSEELEARYTVAVGDSGLTIGHRKSEAMPLRIAFGDAWIAPFGTVRFTREKGKVTGFSLTGGRVRNVAFRRER